MSHFRTFRGRDMLSIEKGYRRVKVSIRRYSECLRALFSKNVHHKYWFRRYKSWAVKDGTILTIEPQAANLCDPLQGMEEGVGLKVAPQTGSQTLYLVEAMRIHQE